jgi:hypothetical protein
MACHRSLRTIISICHSFLPATVPNSFCLKIEKLEFIGSLGKRKITEYKILNIDCNNVEIKYDLRWYKCSSAGTKSLSASQMCHDKIKFERKIWATEIFVIDKPYYNYKVVFVKVYKRN